MSKRQAIPGGRNVPGRFSTRWHESAACKGKPIELFYGTDGEDHAQRMERERVAVALCGGCIVRKQCEAHALSVPEKYGVWGGTTEASRSAERSKMPAA